MPRKHLFVIVVLLGAALVAGFLATTRTQALGSPAASSTGPDAAISFRLQKLDRLEAKLAREIAVQGASTSPSPITVYRSSTGSFSTSAGSELDDEHEHAEDHAEDDRDD